ncbi:MAG: sigma 54-interacting transcriptional regulator [Alphaproteobacteria bacterium]|nr:sigma 54-interacting transcriptional regulator [Alphaproteobacteria bacterium]
MTPRHALHRWLHHVSAPDAFAALANLLPDAAVFAVDADRNVILWSEGAERLLGLPPDEILGQHCLKANRCATCMQGCGIAQHGQVQGVPLTLHREDGGPLRVRKTARAFFDADGSFAGGIEILWPEAEAPEVKHEAEPPLLPDDFHGILSQDPAMQQVFRIIRNVAETDASVLIRGESGTGKELVARAIHAESHRRDAPFLAVNCAALSPQLLESELFGHERGAFTGATKDRPGLLRRADGGTLLLDEVAELPLDLQAKLLRAIQEQSFLPVGSDRSVQVDLRFLAATHRSLRAEVKAGRFREDLMYRLRVVPVFLPPLRDRRGDIDLLLRHFIRLQNGQGPRRIARVQPEAMRALLDHPWPGNVRELRNVVQYAFAVGRGPELRLHDLPPEFRESLGPERPIQAPVELVPSTLDEASRIRLALEHTGGHVGEAAELLGMSRPTFWRKRKKYGID